MAYEKYEVVKGYKRKVPKYRKQIITYANKLVAQGYSRSQAFKIAYKHFLKRRGKNGKKKKR